MKKIVIISLLIVFVVSSFFIYSRYSEKDKVTINNIFKADKYKSYKAGDSVSFKGESWSVMYDSNSNSNYVTLINSALKYYEDIPNVVDGIYETSAINKYLKNTLAKEYGEKNLVEKNGYAIRLLNMDDLERLTEYSYEEKNDAYILKECPDYICLTNSSYATMIDTDNQKEFLDVYTNLKDVIDLEDEEYLVHLNYYNLKGTYYENSLESIVDDITLFVRPVINVYKNSLD